MTKTLYVAYYQPGFDEYIVAVTFDQAEAIEKAEDSRLDLSPAARQISRHIVVGYLVDVAPNETPQQVFDRLDLMSLDDPDDYVFSLEITLPNSSY